MRNAYKLLVRKPERKTPYWKRECRCEGNIGMDLREIGWKGIDWIPLVQDRDLWWALVNMVMNLWAP
jgi:hypothetical protein